MSTVAQRFTKFLQNIQLTENQIEDAKIKHTGVRSTLHNHYYGSQKATGIPYNYGALLSNSYLRSEVLQEQSSSSTSYLVGSYGKNTAIRPPSDIDILFIIPPHLFSKYNQNLWNGQSRLLQDVKQALKSNPLYWNTDISGDGQVVSVKFTSYAVEVVPAFATTAEYYWYPNTHNGGSWRDTNPKAEKAALSGSNSSTSGNTIRLIKMMKAWKKQCNVPLKSLGIELTVVDFLSTYWNKATSATNYHCLVRDYLEYLTQHKNSPYLIPGIGERLYLGDSWFSRAETAHKRAKQACGYESANCPRCATEEWKKIFGREFEYLD